MIPNQVRSSYRFLAKTDPIAEADLCCSFSVFAVALFQSGNDQVSVISVSVCFPLPPILNGAALRFKRELLMIQNRLVLKTLRSNTIWLKHLSMHGFLISCFRPPLV
jgi:hypothetical protein